MLRSKPFLRSLPSVFIILELVPTQGTAALVGVIAVENNPLLDTLVRCRVQKVIKSLGCEHEEPMRDMLFQLYYTSHVDSVIALSSDVSAVG